MKNNLIKYLILSALFILVSQTGFCDTNAAAETAKSNSELIVMVIKFGKVMLGVVLASVVIYFLLLIWNAILKRSAKPKITDLSLRTPQNVDDAILFFINKNKLN